MSDPQFVEFAGKKEYKCPKCKTPIRYAKFFGSDKKLLTTDGKEPFAGQVDGKFKSNTGWPTNPITKLMHECHTPEAREVDIIDKSLLDNGPKIKELNVDDLGMQARKSEVLTECAVLWKEEEWITEYLTSKGRSNPNPAKVGMWHKMIDERLRRNHEPD